MATSEGKYPPAEPGALELEPLKAAGRSLNEATLTFRPPTQKLPNWKIPRNWRSSRAVCEAPRKEGGVLSSTRVTHDFDAATLQEMSNCYCLPGRAGGPPLDVSANEGRRVRRPQSSRSYAKVIFLVSIPEACPSMSTACTWK